ncbi:protein of unknown function [Burkholderia multivorans]
MSAGKQAGQDARLSRERGGRDGAVAPFFSVKYVIDVVTYHSQENRHDATYFEHRAVRRHGHDRLAHRRGSRATRASRDRVVAPGGRERRRHHREGRGSVRCGQHCRRAAGA